MFSSWINLITVAIVLCIAGQANANGRAPGTSTINFRQGGSQDIAAGLTFGVVLSHDGGASWHWMCEKAVVYGGMFDPDYAYASTGALFATTFDGSLVNRDGCTFAPTVFGKKFFASITLGPDGALFMAAADVPDGMGSLGDAKIYKSTDGGTTFPTVATAGVINDWYNSIEVAPTDPSRVYLSAYRLTNGTRSLQIYKSVDGGATFNPVTVNTFTTSQNSTIDIVGIKAGTPDTVFARVSFQNGGIGDAIWRSDNGGTTWTKIFEQPDSIAFVARANGDLVAATQGSGTFVARGPNNTAWESVAGAPHINCLVENPTAELWACTQNFGSVQSPSDGAGIMKSTDLTTWVPVLKYQDIAGPVDCAAGTRQHDQCVYDCPDPIYDANPMNCPNITPKAWCTLKRQIGITSDVLACPELFDAPPDSLTVRPNGSSGCCEAGASGDGRAALLFGFGVTTLISRRRRHMEVR